MKLIAVNGSPRPSFNTAKLVKEAARGAQEAGAEVEYIDLYKLANKGCISCFACKRQGREAGVCQVHDDMQPLYERIAAADALVLGSPVYFGDVTAGAEAFLERLVFPALSYDDFSSRPFTGKVNCGLILTMNAGDPAYYQRLMEEKGGMLGKLHGRVEAYASAFTVQFTDYAKYHAAAMNGPERLAHQAEQFPRDLQACYEMGRRLVASAE